MIEALLTPFQFSFMNKAFFIIILLSIPCSLLSCYLVIKGWSLVGDAISHAILPGVSLAYILGISLIIGATIAGVACILLSGFISDKTRIKNDTSMGIVFSGMFALGIILVSNINTNLDLNHIIFGNLLGIQRSEIVNTTLIAIFTSFFLILRRKDLLLFSFDPIQAFMIGINVKIIYYLFLIVISLIVVSNLYTVGLILSIGLIILPGSIAFLISKNFFVMQLISVFSTLISVFLGLYFSFFIDSSPAPTIILMLSIIFVIIFLFKTCMYNQFLKSKIFNFII